MPERSHRARDGPGYRPDGLRPVVGRRPGARKLGLVEGRTGAGGVPISLARGPRRRTSRSQVPSPPPAGLKSRAIAVCLLMKMGASLSEV